MSKQAYHEEMREEDINTRKIFRGKSVLEDLLYEELDFEDVMLRIEALRGLNLMELEAVFIQTIDSFKNKLLKTTTVKDCRTMRTKKPRIPDWCFDKERSSLTMNSSSPDGNANQGHIGN